MEIKKEINHQQLKYFNIPVLKNGIYKTLNVFNDTEENNFNNIKHSNGICLFYETNKDYLERNGCQLKVYFIKYNLSHIYSKFYGPIFHLCGKHLKKINNIFKIDFLSDGVKWLEKKEFHKTSEYIKTQTNDNKTILELEFPLQKNLKFFCYW